MRGAITIDQDLCKGCGLCILACPAECLTFGDTFTRLGYKKVVYAGAGCRLDGLCAAACPEPGAIIVHGAT